MSGFPRKELPHHLADNALAVTVFKCSRLIQLNEIERNIWYRPNWVTKSEYGKRTELKNEGQYHGRYAKVASL